MLVVKKWPKNHPRAEIKENKMSYDISIVDPVTRETIQLNFKHNMRGGTYAVGGTILAELNITYNYSSIFQRVLGPGGIRSIYDLTGGESIPILSKAILELNNDVTESYWEPTEGNAKLALLDVLKLAFLCPYGVWTGD